MGLVWRVNLFKFLPLWINVVVARNQYWNLKINVSKKKKKSKICRYSFYKHKRINVLICRITWKDIATFLQSLASTTQKNDIKLIKSYWLLVFVNERKIEPIVIEKSNQFVSFKFGDVQLVDIFNCLGAATSLKYFLKAYKASETGRFFSIKIVQWSREAQKH